MNRDSALPLRASSGSEAVTVRAAEPPRTGVAGRPGSGRLAGLDALRAIAALTVVVMHVGAIWPGAPRVIGAAYLAVDFFFLLSGFVMARTYEARMRAGTLGPWRFLAARYRRLWPTMALGALLSAPFLWRDNRDLAVFLGAALPNLLLLPSFATPVLFALNTPAWSVFFELVANLAHAALLRRLSTPALAGLAGLFLAAAGALALHFGDLDIGSRAADMAGGLARVGFSYALGIVLWRRFGERTPIPVPAAPAFAALAFAAMPALFVGATLGHVEGARFDLAFVALACPLLLWGGLAFRAGSRRVERACLAAGALSFPLYAVHYPVLLACEAAGLPMALGPCAAVAAAALATWALGGFRHIAGAMHTS